jgi:hypothetical protein
MTWKEPLTLGAAVVLLAVTTLLAAACGSSSPAASAAPDHDASAPTEGGSIAPDAADDAPSTAPILDAGSQPDAFAQGTQLVARPATDGGGRIAEVIGLDGGGAATIATGTNPNATALLVQVSGPVVFAWTDRGSGTSTLTLWSSAKGVVSKGAGIRPGQGAASADGSLVAYQTHPSTDTATIVFGPIASSTTTAVSQIDVPSTPCWQDVDMAFVGGDSPRLLSFFCPNGSTSFTVRSVDPNDGGFVDLTTSAVAETFGESAVVYQDATGLLAATAPDGTRSVTLATNAASFALSQDQASVVFQTTANSVVTSPIGAASPRLAAAAGTGLELGPISPDKSRVLFASQLADGGADQVALYSDVQLATFAPEGDDAGGADASATVRALVASSTSCPNCLNDSFTPDSTHAMALDPIDDSQSAGGTGPLHVFPLDGGADWRLGASVYTIIALGTGSGDASRFLFVEATPDMLLADGYAFTLYTRALTPSATPTAIGADVEAAGLNAAKTAIVYSIPGGGPLAGVWTTALE